MLFDKSSWFFNIFWYNKPRKLEVGRLLSHEHILLYVFCCTCSFQNVYWLSRVLMGHTFICTNIYPIWTSTVKLMLLFFMSVYKAISRSNSVMYQPVILDMFLCVLASRSLFASSNWQLFPWNRVGWPLWMWPTQTHDLLGRNLMKFHCTCMNGLSVLAGL